MPRIKRAPDSTPQRDAEAKTKFSDRVSRPQLEQLKSLVADYGLSVAGGDIQLLSGNWYVTHAGLLRLARRNRCSGIQTEVLESLSIPKECRWVVKATVFKTARSKGFVGYGDANPSNVSSLVRGAEMRVAETRAVNRALRKAYGIGLCSVEELCAPNTSLPYQTVLESDNKDGNGGPRLRDRLLLLIRQHRLDARQVKRYAARFCGTTSLREATREQIEGFVDHLASRAVEDRDRLLADMSAEDPQPRAGSESNDNPKAEEAA